MNKLFITSSPHIRHSESTSKIMLSVLIALMPCTVFGIINFGWQTLFIITLSVVTAVLSEYICNKAMKRPVSIGDFSAAVTGLLYALILPPSAPWYTVVLGSVFAIVIAKQLFGGIGANVVNPALAARAFIMLSFPTEMTSFITDVFTSPTPLNPEAAAGTYSLDQLFIGNLSGCIGETAKWAVILGFLFLVLRRVITITIPLVITAAAMLTSLALGRDPIFDILAGGLLFGAVFMATDYVCSPMTLTGQIIYAVLIGVLIILIRAYGAYPEGVTYAILLLNVATPLIDKLIRQKSFGKAAAQ